MDPNINKQARLFGWHSFKPTLSLPKGVLRSAAPRLRSPTARAVGSTIKWGAVPSLLLSGIIDPDDDNFGFNARRISDASKQMLRSTVSGINSTLQFGGAIGKGLSNAQQWALKQAGHWGTAALQAPGRWMGVRQQQLPQWWQNIKQSAGSGVDWAHDAVNNHMQKGQNASTILTGWIANHPSLQYQAPQKLNGTVGTLQQVLMPSLLVGYLPSSLGGQAFNLGRLADPATRVIGGFSGGVAGKLAPNSKLVAKFLRGGLTGKTPGQIMSRLSRLNKTVSAAKWKAIGQNFKRGPSGIVKGIKNSAKMLYDTPAARFGVQVATDAPLIDRVLGATTQNQGQQRSKTKDALRDVISASSWAGLVNPKSWLMPLWTSFDNTKLPLYEALGSAGVSSLQMDPGKYGSWLRKATELSGLTADSIQPGSQQAITNLAGKAKQLVKSMPDGSNVDGWQRTIKDWVDTAAKTPEAAIGLLKSLNTQLKDKQNIQDIKTATGLINKTVELVYAQPGHAKQHLQRLFDTLGPDKTLRILGLQSSSKGTWDHVGQVVNYVKDKFGLPYQSGLPYIGAGAWQAFRQGNPAVSASMDNLQNTWNNTIAAHQDAIDDFKSANPTFNKQTIPQKAKPVKQYIAHKINQATQPVQQKANQLLPQDAQAQKARRRRQDLMRGLGLGGVGLALGGGLYALSQLDDKPKRTPEEQLYRQLLQQYPTWQQMDKQQRIQAYMDSLVVRRYIQMKWKIKDV